VTLASQAIALALVAVLASVSGAAAQRAAPHTSEPSPATHAAGTHHAHHSPAFEFEFAGSEEFQASALSLRLASRLRAELRYYGVEENDIGIAGLGYEWRIGALRLMPGVGWAFGRQNRPAFVFTARWAFENESWVSQGAWVQSMRHYERPRNEPHGEHGHGEPVEIVRYAGVLDGMHVSRRIGRVEVGPMAEHIRYREENSWKAGGRVAVRLGTGFRLIAQVVGPGTEVRGGISWER
jgi:hypothetical protein